MQPTAAMLPPTLSTQGNNGHVYQVPGSAVLVAPTVTLPHGMPQTAPEAPTLPEAQQAYKVDRLFVFNVKACAVFLGGITLNFLAYGWMSPYWFMMNTRAYSEYPELRVLGLRHIVEGREGSFSIVTGTNELKKNIKIYSLAARKARVCDKALPDEDITGEGTSDCDLDCQDMRLLGNVEVVCPNGQGGRNRHVYPIPIPPNERLRKSLGGGGDANATAEDTRYHEDDVKYLRYGCDKKKSWFASTFKSCSGLKCPDGYTCCSRSDRKNCNNGKNKWHEPCCVMSKKEIGDPLFGMRGGPNYVHVFGWATWQIEELRWTPEQAAKETDVKQGSWCAVRHLRCETLNEFTSNGYVCSTCLGIAGVLSAAALAWLVAREQPREVMCIAILYLLVTIITLAATFQYRSATEAAVDKTMTPIDDYGRPYVHPMKNYNDANRSIVKNKNTYASAEWTYYHINARVDYATADEDENRKRGFLELWGFTVAQFGGCFALFSALACLELQFALRGRSPVSEVGKVLIRILMFIPSKMKGFIDTKVAPYPVLYVYPWQRLYPKAFTVGTFLPWPLDFIYDSILMTPCHVIRAVWDYVSCQDICSPQERRKLRQHGIYNDRLQSLLCSRRSYFVMMAGLGVVSWVVGVVDVVHISNSISHYKQALSIETSYPRWRCNYMNGTCPLERPDHLALRVYLGDMIIMLYATVMEGANYCDTVKAIVLWLAGFVSVFCACGALALWTNFSLSRRFCIVGWLIMSITPIVTSALAPNDFIDWNKAEERMLNVGAEVWEEVAFYASTQPCEESAEMAKMGMDRGRQACGWVASLSWIVRKTTGDSLVRTCGDFESFDRQYSQSMMNHTLAICDALKQYREDGPESRKEIKRRLGKYTPTIRDVFKAFVSLRAGFLNSMQLVAAVMSMAPALMQGGLMVKNMVPKQTMPSILTTLPWAFTLLFWAQYQTYYQILGGYFFLTAVLCLSFGPLLYYGFAKEYRVIQPMCDQQSVTLTFRIWYYALVFALIIPYVMMLTYILTLNTFKSDMLSDAVVGWILRPTAQQITQLFSDTLSKYAYTLQAGIDWFVDELVEHHLSQHIPVVLSATESRKEAELLQKMLGTSIDENLIDEGTFVCGGLGDPDRLYPDKVLEGASWNHKAKVYAASLAFKDYATLDQFAGHLKNDTGLPRVLAASRRSWFHLLSHPPAEAFIHQADMDEKALVSKLDNAIELMRGYMAEEKDWHKELEKVLRAMPEIDPVVLAILEYNGWIGEQFQRVPSCKTVVEHLLHARAEVLQAEGPADEEGEAHLQGSPGLPAPDLPAG